MIYDYLNDFIGFYITNIVYICDNYFTTINYTKKMKNWFNMTKKELIVSLIKDDLTNIRLVYGLDALGLDSGDYYLHLSETIFKLVGITTDDEEFFEEYMDECRTVHTIDIFKHPELLNSLALSLYNKLIEECNSHTHEQ